MAQAQTYWYRFEDRRYANSADQWGYATGSTLQVHLQEFPVISLTPTGAWLEVRGSARFTKQDVRKRFACPTKQEALESFIARKKRQASIYEARAKGAHEAIYQATSLMQRLRP